jgi:hypothetical protein
VTTARPQLQNAKALGHAENDSKDQ